MAPRPESVFPLSPTPLRGTPPRPVGFSAACLVVLALGTGCGTSIRGEAEPEPPAPLPSPPVVVVEQDPPPPPPDRTEEILAEGAAYLAIGDFATSRSRLEYVLDRSEEAGNGVRPELRARALWHLGILHLVQDGSERDEDRALSILTRLTEEYPATAEGVQARWLRGILEELDGARRRTVEQEQRIQELNDTVEQLRRIDLNRRPAPPRSDTLNLPSGGNR
jgi:hypothetical protein